MKKYDLIEEFQNMKAIPIIEEYNEKTKEYEVYYLYADLEGIKVKHSPITVLWDDTFSLDEHLQSIAEKIREFEYIELEVLEPEKVEYHIEYDKNYDCYDHIIKIDNLFPNWNMKIEHKIDYVIENVFENELIDYSNINRQDGYIFNDFGIAGDDLMDFIKAYEKGE